MFTYFVLIVLNPYTLYSLRDEADQLKIFLQIASWWHMLPFLAGISFTAPETNKLQRIQHCPLMLDVRRLNQNGAAVLK